MSWPLVKIKDVGRVFTGKTPSKATDEYFGGDIPFVTPAELDGDVYVCTAKQTLNELGAKQIKLLPKDSVMVCCIGSLGKIGIAGRELATNQQINSVVFDEAKVFSKYGFYALSLLRPILEKIAPSTTVPIVNKSNFESLEIPLPPLEEQIRIAAILDKADAIRRKRQQAIKLADDFLRSVFLEMFGDPVTNPKGWEVKKLGEVAELINGDRSSNYPSGDDLKESGILFLNTKNITDNKIELFDPVFITEEKFNSLSRGKLQREDLVITLRGTLGSCAIFNTEYDTGFINAQLMIIRPKVGVTSDFLHAYLTSDQIHDVLQSLGRGAAVPQLTGAQMKDLDVYIPNVELLDKFKKIKNTVSNVKFKCNVAEKAELFVSLSQKAFSGQL